MSEWTESAKIKSLDNIEKDLHSIDVSLGRIAVALERLASCVSDENKSFVPEFRVKNH